MFEVVEPILEGDEVFDSSLLKQMVESMIAAGNRNICVDLTGQDYLYSDAINALVGINKRMLDVMGRLSLVAPQPPVVEILKKGGIANILKIFENDDELMRVSQQLMGGAPPVVSAPAAPTAPQEPQSEFDELRSEIGSAFGSIAPAVPPQAPQRRAAIPPPSPFADAGFRQGPRPAFPPAQPQFAPPPPVTGGAPRYAPPPLRTFEPAAQKPPVPRPTVPPPPPVAKLPAAPIVSGGETRRMSNVPEIPTPPPVRTQYQPQPDPQPEAVFAPRPEEDLNKFEATLEKKAVGADVPKRDRFDDDLEIAKKKPSFVPVLVALVVLIGLGAGGYFAYTAYSKKSISTPAVAPSSTPETAIPQVPVPAPEPSEAKPADTQATATPVVAKTPEKKPVPVVSPVADAKAAAAKVAAAEKAAAAKVVAAEKAAAAKEAAAEKAAAAKDAAAKVSAAREAAIKEAGARAAAAREAAAKAAAAKAAEPPPVARPSVVEVFDEPAPAPAPAPRPVVSAPPPAPEPEPAPAAAPEATAPASGEAATVFLASIPPLADVYMDGKLIGKSNSILTVATGAHTLRFVKGDKEITKQFTFTPGKNSPSFVKLP